MAVSPFDSALTGGLVGDAEVAAIFDDRRQLRAMLRVEAGLARAQGRLGAIPAEAAERIAAAADTLQPDPAALAERTARDGVPVSALVAALRQALDDAAARWVHFGATSQDVVDTALVLQLREFCDLLDARLAGVVRQLAALAREHRATPAVARTRTQQAVPTSFGLRVVAWLRPLAQERRRLAELRDQALRLQLGGAGGSLSAAGPEAVDWIEAVAAELGLPPAVPAWHGERGGLLALADALTRIAGALGKLGQDVALASQSEVGELRIAGGGSSTMPHKANPVGAEVLVALARHAAGLSGSLHQAQLHGQERDGAAWTLEWLTLPQIAACAGGALAKASQVLDGLQVDTGRMAAHVTGGRGLVLAEAATFALADHMPRPEAQALVGEACRQAVERDRDLLDLLAERTAAPVDWPALRTPEHLLGSAPALVDRALADLAADETP